jgi:6-phosphogluconolactonase (cycloisomerase 2 family)
MCTGLIEMQPGSGPRYIAANKDAVFVINELASMIESFWRGEDGFLT